MGQKQYTIIPEENPGTVPKEFEQVLKNSLLLALLEKQYINRWQYECCCAKLELTTVTENGEPR